MGKHFGNLQKLKGVYYYTLSPLEINPMIMMGGGLKNVFRRFLRVFALGALPVSTSFMTYYWGMNTYHELQRKNPDDFKNDV